MTQQLKLEPATVGSLLDDVEWFFRYYRNEAEIQVVMNAFDVHRAKAIEWTIDRLTPRDRTVLHIFTGGWGPKGRLVWKGLDHFEGFGPVLLGTEAAQYMAEKAGEDVVTYTRRLERPGDNAEIDELIAVGKEHVQAALLAYQQMRRNYLVRSK